VEEREENPFIIIITITVTKMMPGCIISFAARHHLYNAVLRCCLFSI
jgi:hypothetical protein